MNIHSRVSHALAPDAPAEVEASATGLASDRMVDLKISGMHCAACVARVEGALAAVPGVETATVNLATERARVRLAGPVPDERLAAAVREIGYGARRVASPFADDEELAERRIELADVLRRFVIAATLAV